MNAATAASPVRCRRCHRRNTMNYKEYVVFFRKQLEALPYQKQFDLAFAVCKKLYFKK
jgi:hypothetical protein